MVPVCIAAAKLPWTTHMYEIKVAFSKKVPFDVELLELDTGTIRNPEK